MPSETQTISKGRLWAGRIIGGLPALFLLVDAIMKFIKPAPVIDAILLTWFSIVFPVVFGVLLWGGLWLRDGRLKSLIPVRT